ncbi:MAG: LuxR C-terminal-related transcriptional regulator, partial [Ilumatobacteraceae bacterium]
LASAAAAVAAGGMLSPALAIAHDAIRLGHPDAVVDLLSEFATQAPGTLAARFRDHAVAAVSGDDRSLIVIARDFEHRGMGALGAEIRLGLARSLQTSDPARSRWLVAEATAGFHDAGVEPSPLLDPERTITSGSQRPALTARQLDIARLAGRRLRSKEIAEQLGISSRTVDNLLGQVYRALGISSREELTTVLDVGHASDAPTRE